MNVTPGSVLRAPQGGGVLLFVGGNQGKEPSSLSKGVLASSSTMHPSESLISSALSATHVDIIALYKTVLQLLWFVERDLHNFRTHTESRICIIFLRFPGSEFHCMELAFFCHPITTQQISVAHFQHTVLHSSNCVFAPCFLRGPVRKHTKTQIKLLFNLTSM
jgi:hypothetical protein